MRGKLSHFVLLLMAFCLLTGSVGVAATQRICAMWSTVPVSQKRMEAMGCCASKKLPPCQKGTSALDKEPCCKVSTSHQKLEIETGLVIPKVQFAFALPLPAAPSLLFGSSTPSSPRAWPFYTDTSPPLAGRQLLQRLHILNI